MFTEQDKPRVLPDSFYEAATSEEEDAIDNGEEVQFQSPPLMLISTNECHACRDAATTAATTHTTATQPELSTQTSGGTNTRNLLSTSTTVVWTHLMETFTTQQLTLVNDDDYSSDDQQATPHAFRLRWMAIDESTQEPKNFRWTKRGWKDAQGSPIYGRWFQAILVESWYTLHLVSADTHDDVSYHITGLIASPHACAQPQ